MISLTRNAPVVFFFFPFTFALIVHGLGFHRFDDIKNKKKETKRKKKLVDVGKRTAHHREQATPGSTHPGVSDFPQQRISKKNVKRRSLSLLVRRSTHVVSLILPLVVVNLACQHFLDCQSPISFFILSSLFSLFFLRLVHMHRAPSPLASSS